MARIEQPSSELLGWAAVRLLPASALLLAVLVWFSFQVTPTTHVAEESQSEDDLLTWVLEESETYQ